MNRYCYWQLNKNEQKIYTQISKGIADSSSCVKTNATTKENITNIIRSVLIDNPQYFWFEGRVLVKKDKNEIIIKPHYLYGITEIESAIKLIEGLVRKFSCYQNSTDFDKAKVAYDWFTENVCYSMENGGQNIHNAFIEKAAVCKGLSKAYQYILLKLGVFSTLAEGTIDGVARHIWNIVEIDGDYFNVDISMSYSNFDHFFDSSQSHDKYRMFLKPDAELKQIHRWQNSGCCPRLICNKTYKKDML